MRIYRTAAGGPPLPDDLAPFFHGAPKEGWLSESTRDHALSLPNLAPEWRERLEAATEEDFDDEQRRRLEARLHYSVESYLQDPPAPLTLLELELFLAANPTLSVEYLGRNPIIADEVVTGLPTAPAQVFAMDICGGRRRYLWRSHLADARFPDTDPREQFAALRRWFEDPEARVVLSLGSGGMRMFSITAILKILDMIGVRDRIGEIWGCSGGAVMGLPYAEGVSPHWIEQIGYDYYNEKHPELALKRSGWRTAIAFLRQQSSRFARPGAGLADVQGVIFKAIAEAISHRNPRLRRIPFYAIASNSTQGRVHALAAPEFIPEHARQLLSPADPLQAAAASAAIPFVFPAERIAVSPAGAEEFVDGMFGEETPYFYPLLKWQRDRLYDPNTPKRLKIFSVDIGSRYSEIQVVSRMRFGGRLREGLAYAGRLLDIAYDSRRQFLHELVNHMPDAELIGLRLRLDRAATLSVEAIPHIIQRGRICFFEQLVEWNERLLERESRPAA